MKQRCTTKKKKAFFFQTFSFASRLVHRAAPRSAFNFTNLPFIHAEIDKREYKEKAKFPYKLPLYLRGTNTLKCPSFSERFLTKSPPMSNFTRGFRLDKARNAFKSAVRNQRATSPPTTCQCGINVPGRRPSTIFSVRGTVCAPRDVFLLSVPTTNG